MKKILPGASLKLHSYHNALNLKKENRPVVFNAPDGAFTQNFHIMGANVNIGTGVQDYEIHDTANEPFNPGSLLMKQNGSGGFCMFELTNLSKPGPANWFKPITGTVSIVAYGNGGFAESSAWRKNGETAIKNRLARKPTTLADVLESGRTFEIDLTPLMKPGQPFANNKVVLSSETLEKMLKDRVLKAQEKMGALSWINDPAEPTLRQGDGAAFYSSKGGHKVEQEGLLIISQDVPLYLMYDTETGQVTSLASLEDPGNTAAEGDAIRAIRERNDLLKTYILNKAEGRATTAPPAERPPATEAPDLNEEVKQHCDEWWETYQAARTQAMAATGPSSQTAYDNYTAGGGAKNKAEWEADAPARIAAAKGDAESSDWLKTAGAALGWVGDKASSALSWLGDAGLDLLKSWGPAGVVGAYAGVKAVNSADKGDISKLLLYGGLAAGAILLLR